MPSLPSPPIFLSLSHLDVVEVDLGQAAVVAMDPLQSLLHIGGVGQLVREDLEGIRFDHTCQKIHNFN